MGEGVSDGIVLRDGTVIGLDEPAGQHLEVMCQCGARFTTPRELLEHLMDGSHDERP